ncbi:MAG: ATP-binding protein [Desulfomicrobium sp.]
MLDTGRSSQRRSLIYTVAMYLLLPTLFIFVCIFLYAIQTLGTQFRSLRETEIQILASTYRERVEGELHAASQVLRAIGLSFQGESISEAALNHAFQAWQKELAWLKGITVMDKAGERLVLAGHPDLEDARSIISDLSGAPPSGVAVSKIRVGSDGLASFQISAPLPNDPRERLACLSVNAVLFSAILDRERVGRTGEVFLIDTSGVLQTGSVLHGGILDSVDPVLAAAAPQEKVIAKREWKGTRLWASVLPVTKNPNWRLVVQRDEREMLEPLTAQTVRHLFYGLLGLAILCAAALFTVKKILARQESMDAERARLAEYRMQVQKLDAISQLGVGIAHEVNNPLAIIGEEAGWMQDVLKRESFKDHPDAGELREALRQIVAQTARSREITHKLLSFGGKTDGTIRDVRINTLVSDVATLRRREASQKNIEIHEILEPDLPVILSEPALLRQLLINLINNAMDAMPEGGSITIRTKRGDEGVCLQIEDSGFGIPDENMGKIFDPFFTTKAPGKGAGLGLSISHGILQRIGGRIFAASRPGHGSTFTVQLPVEAQPKPSCPPA